MYRLTKFQRLTTRETRMPMFWEYPPLPHDYPYYWFISDPKSKQDKLKTTNLKKMPKIQMSIILQKSLYATYLLKWLDMIYKYEMDPVSIVEDTEQTPFLPQTDRWMDTDWRTEGQGEISKTPFQFHWSGV